MAWVQSPVGKLRSYKPQSMAKQNLKKKKNHNISIKKKERKKKNRLNGLDTRERRWQDLLLIERRDSFITSIPIEGPGLPGLSSHSLHPSYTQRSLTHHLLSASSLSRKNPDIN